MSPSLLRRVAVVAIFCAAAGACMDGGLGYQQTGQVPLQYPLDIGAFYKCSPPGPCDEIVRVELELALDAGFSSATVHPWTLETTVQGIGDVEPAGAAISLDELP